MHCWIAVEHRIGPFPVGADREASSFTTASAARMKPAAALLSDITLDKDVRNSALEHHVPDLCDPRRLYNGDRR